jgi:predicted nucleic acid-binding protein
VADVLVDTDVFIDHLRGARALAARRNRLHYSVITRAELFAANTATDLTATLLAPFREIPVDRRDGSGCVTSIRRGDGSSHR